MHKTGRKRFKAFTLIILVVMVLGMMPLQVLGAPADIQNHWAETHIQNWLDKGLAFGYADGTFRPNNSVTRAEFAIFANRAFKMPESREYSGFTDVKEDDWYFREISVAVKAGIMSGYQDGTFRPDNPITRQEAASVISRILSLGTADAVATLDDIDQVADWAKGAVDAVVEEGVMGGYPDNTFRPDSNITRAETIVTLDRAMVEAEPVLEEVLYDQPGTYGPEEGIETVEGNVTVDAEGITLRNMHITGNLILDEGIGEGDAHLQNVSVVGETIVRGGGPDSITFEDCTMPGITVSKEGVRIVATGNTTVNVVTLESGATLVEVTVSGPGFETVTISEVVPADAQITLSGDFEAVTVAAAGAQVEIAEGSVQTLTLETEAEITGEGTIETAVINAEGATIAQQPTNVEVKEGVSASVGGKEVTGPPPTPLATPPAGGGGGGGGGGGDSSVAVSAISVTGDAVVGATLTATGLIPAGATVTYQWKISTDGTTYVDIDSETSATYTIVAGDAGKYIKVAATGTGSYTGTVTSVATVAVQQSDEALLAADKALIEAGTYEIPLASQGDQATKTAWVQSAVEALIENGTTATVSWNAGETKYDVALALNAVNDTATITVTEEVPVAISSFADLETFNEGTSTIGMIAVSTLTLGGDFSLSGGKTLIVPSDTAIYVPAEYTFTVKDSANAKLEDGTTQILAVGTCVVESGANLIMPKVMNEETGDKVFFSYIGTGEDAFYQLTDGTIEITIVNGTNMGVTIKGTAILQNAKVGGEVIRNTEQLWSGDETTIAAGKSLTIASNTVLDVQAGAKLTNNGTLIVNGTLKASGTLDGSGTLDVHGTLDATTWNSFDSFINEGTIVAYAGSTILLQEETPIWMIGESGLDVDTGQITISKNGTNGTSFTLPTGSTATVKGSWMDGDANGYRIASNDRFTVQGTLNIDYRTEVSGILEVVGGNIVVGAEGEIHLFDTGTGGSGKLISAAGTVTGTPGAKVTFNSSHVGSTLNGTALTKGESYNWSNNKWDKVTP